MSNAKQEFNDDQYAQNVAKAVEQWRKESNRPEYKPGDVYTNSRGRYNHEASAQRREEVRNILFSQMKGYQK